VRSRHQRTADEREPDLHPLLRVHPPRRALVVSRAPMKTMILRDPVHDLVRFETEEEAIVPALLEAREVQRLRRIKQLGVTNLVYAGAEHSRFTHALGSAHVMAKLVRRLREMHEELPFWQRLASDRARD
jgi:HD superfamily phosphohydrolase